MVVVRVRDQNRVDTPQRLGVDGHRAPKVGDAVSEQRIGEETDTVEVDEDRGVSDELDSHHAWKRYTQSLSPWASGSDSSFLSVLFSIWRMRSRVTPNACPTSSSVHGCAPSRP